MKHIKINEEVKLDLIEKFKTYINNAKLTDTHLSFSANLNSTVAKGNERPTIFVTATAYLKMMLYVRDTSTEIAWHGTVTRDIKDNSYYIHDVFLYPQKLSSATVQTDQEKYNKWIMELDDETHNTMRFQGHSHVNFGASPSGTDLQFYNDILQVLPKNDYYIFMIMNKSGDMSWFIYDLEKNTIYETTDIDIQIFNETDYDIIDNISKQKTEFCEKPVIAARSYGTTNYSLLGKFKDYDDYYEKEENYLMNRDVPPKSKQTSVDDLFDDIDKKWKNAKLKAKGGKKK